ncbi:hypothetical protein [Streptomyces silvisoli]|uniref:Uncharacterized protein n=1 Tax=Streptomyces silvisoli TaxID=3034235 RepID=A0ABT5ZK00_9ACTN|nr:hypothetical protein [Streptomyces silvisoli]MDF3290162.1 hypothetical protein [Streptomyces silvisoli]
MTVLKAVPAYGHPGMLLGIRVENDGEQTAWYKFQVTVKGDNGFDVTHILNFGTVDPGPAAGAGMTLAASPGGPPYATHPVVTIDRVWRTVNSSSGGG